MNQNKGRNSRWRKAETRRRRLKEREDETGRKRRVETRVEKV